MNNYQKNGNIKISENSVKNKGVKAIKNRLDTYCGLYCGSCEIFITNQKGEVKETAKKWGMNPDDLYCNGCKTDTTSVFCRNCEIKECAKNNEVEFCFQCRDFPCEKIIEFKNDENPHHTIVLKNLTSIKEMGINKWLKEQEKRWSCPNCQENFSWYDEKCLNCGSSLKSCIDDENEINK